MCYRGRGMAHGFTTAEITYEAPGDGIEDDPYKVADLSLTLRLAETIDAHYPGHPWEIQVSHSQGIATISLPLFMGPINKYSIHLDYLSNDPTCRSAVRGAGEILERYRVPRQGFSLDEFLIARDRIPKQLLGSRGYVPA